VAETGVSGERLRDGGEGEALGCAAAVEKRKERVRSEPRHKHDAEGVGGRMGHGGHRTPPGRRRRHALATRRGSPDAVGRVRARGRRRRAGVGLGHGGQAGPGERRRRGERELGQLWPAGRKGGGSPLREKMIFQILFFK
jgi:hypothetical protein